MSKSKERIYNDSLASRMSLQYSINNGYKVILYTTLNSAMCINKEKSYSIRYECNNLTSEDILGLITQNNHILKFEGSKVIIELPQ